MKIAPTLADGLLRESFKPHWRHADKTASFRNALLRARRFVLDSEMSSFMADLSYAALSKYAARNAVLLENMRKSARLPHKITWIEYDLKARQNRVETEYYNTIAKNSPSKGGWLLETHPDIDTAFRMTECVLSAEADLLPTPNVISWTWMADDRPLPWPNVWTSIPLKTRSLHTIGFGGIKDLRLMYEVDTDLENSSISEAALGMGGYQTNQVGVIRSHVAKEATMKKILEMSDLSCGELRYVWALLSTINEIPVTGSRVASTTGFVARGGYRKYLDHDVIILRVPGHKTIRELAQAIVRAARRKAHVVRGHFRKDHWRPGKRIWVHEHERGDRSLGFVIHDYVVTKDPPEGDEE